MASRKLVVRALTNLDPFGYEQAIARGRVEGQLPARHKWNYDASPYCVPNEFICGELARFIGLPIPCFTITRSEVFANRIIFSTLNVNYDGRDFAPVDSAACVRCLPELCAGVLMLDILIANSDRHDENIVVDSNQKPKLLYIYDHDVALFGYHAKEGAQRLKSMRGRLGISKGARSAGTRHIFLDHFETNKHFGEWIKRIAHIPHGFTERVCNEAINYGLDQVEANAALDFIKERQDSLPGILNRKKNEFKGIAHWESL